MTQMKSFQGILYENKADLLAGIIAEWNSDTDAPFPGSSEYQHDISVA